MSEIVGNRATCAMCGKPITFVGQYWDHDGEIKPRHPATPKPWKIVVNTTVFTPEQEKEIERIVRATIERALESMIGDGVRQSR